MGERADLASAGRATSRRIVDTAERRIAAPESTQIWPKAALFHREPMPSRAFRNVWGKRKRAALDDADTVFLDPTTGLARTPRSMPRVRNSASSGPGRAIVFITLPGRVMPRGALEPPLR
jgi:hypothetical protein